MKFRISLLLCVFFLVTWYQTGKTLAQRSANATNPDRVVEKLVLEGQKIAADKAYRARTTITANTKIERANAGEITFLAGKEIRLLPGFHVGRGTTFHARINSKPSGKMAESKTDNSNAMGQEQTMGTLIPTEYNLAQNYPNPFNPQTEIVFALPQADHVTLSIFNTLGQKIRTLVAQSYHPGFHTVIWDSKDNHGHPVASGIYLYQIRAGEFVQIRKMSLLR